MGRLSGPFGVRGWIKVVPYTEDVASLLEYRRWLLEDGSQWRPLHVSEARLHGATIVAKVDSIATREDALELKGRAIGVPRESLPPLAEGEAYWSDLVGSTVVNRRGETLGVVEDVQDNGAHGLLRVHGEALAATLIPLVPAIVDSVDLEARRIVVDWERGW